ncbi:MAG: DUF1446 domain-containing protein [Propionibacteriaceae bacterium]|jgi:hypothetical protein|nr:DUF1446 domain-containing protein [Propionibacteriaceae bacterium]
MNTCSVLMPIGGLGAGINKEAFDFGMAMNPDAIAVDAGSTDSGPAYLATATCKVPRMTVKADLEICVQGAVEGGIPLFIGSCGTCGTDNLVDWTGDIVAEILAEHGWQAKIAKIYSQQPAETLERKWDEGKIHALEGAPEIGRGTFADCSNIVAVLGVEPFIEAVQAGAQIILAGRATDTAVIAAYPILKGCDVAASWHGAKTVECGAQCADKEDGMGVLLTVDETGFYVRPLLPDAHCTPYTVSSHLMYENTDPWRLTEPSGTMVTHKAVYTQVDEFTTYVTGSEFEPAEQYTMKLEGARPNGFQNISLVGIANRKICADPERWIRNITAFGVAKLDKLGIDPATYHIDFKAYGFNAVLAGAPPLDAPPPRELGMLLTVTADTQELATRVAKLYQPLLLHFPTDMDEREQLPSFAFPFSPADCPRGETHEFTLYHVVDVDDPLELVRIAYVTV